MKNFLRSFLIVSSLLLQTSLFANTIIVKGYITDPNNRPVANKAVRIYTDSSNTACLLSHTRITNPNGYYIDTLTCNGDIRKIRIDVEDCTGKHIINEPGLSTSNIVESNFIICVTTPGISTSCKAVFSFTAGRSTASKTITFNSAGSQPPTGDSIISRSWNFGDSTDLLTGNSVDPYHKYSKAGTYNACLTIKTKSGCENKYCQSFVVIDSVPLLLPVPVACKAYFTYSLQGYTVKLNSAGSSAGSASDSIISRTWYFSDSTANYPLTGNQVDPSHTFSKPGTYNIYLVIKTKSGCESKYPVTIVIPAPITNCALIIQVTNEKISARKFRFSSSLSTAGQYDSIAQRTWNFGDGTTLDGNEISPLKEFKDTGTYTVCVKIKTKNGCVNDACIRIVVKDSVPPAPIPTNCKALFTYAIQSTTVAFNSSSAAGTSADDSIISRYWVFGDSSAITSGNLITTTHTYTKAGTYLVLFYIKTKKGCESKYVATIVITPNTTFHCEAQASFTAERLSLKKIQFNSSLSKAQAGDSIVQRNWKFGDSSVLGGNVISPAKEFAAIGYYTTCLTIQTAKGCMAQVCKEVTILDSVTTPQSTIEYIKIISINPNPVADRMLLTVWSRNSNTETEIAVYDIYGNSKLSVKKLLTQGNNTIEMSMGGLFHGSYFLKVSTKNGKDSRQFYKL